MVTSFDQLDLTKQYTYADYMTWQFSDRVELIKGWVHKMNDVSVRLHQGVSIHLSIKIGNFCTKKGYKVYAAPFDVRLVNKRKSTADKEITSVVQPDICVICDPSKLDARGCIGAPDWIIEILSPGNTKTEMKKKFELYQENGVKEYWVVFPEYLQIQVYTLMQEKYALQSTYYKDEKIPVGIFDGFFIDTSEIFNQ